MMKHVRAFCVSILFFALGAAEASACGGFLQRPCPQSSLIADHKLNPIPARHNATAYNPWNLDYGYGYGFFEFDVDVAVNRATSRNVLQWFVGITRRLFVDEKRTLLLTLEATKFIDGVERVVGKRVVAAVSYEANNQIRFQQAFEINGRLTNFLRTDNETVRISMKVEHSSADEIDLTLIRNAATELARVTGASIAIGKSDIGGVVQGIESIVRTALGRFNTMNDLSRAVSMSFHEDNTYGVRFYVFDQDQNVAVNVNVNKKIRPSVLSVRVNQQTGVPTVTPDASHNLQVARVGNGVSVLAYLRQPHGYDSTEEGIAFKLGTEESGPLFAKTCATLLEILTRTFTRYDAHALFWSVVSFRAAAINSSPQSAAYKASGCLDDSWTVFQTLSLPAPRGFTRPAGG